MGPRIFISYRREDSGGHTGRLYDALAERFGQDQVFLDVSMRPGVDFVQRIEQAVASCRILLAVIGPRWTTAAGTDRTPRLEDAADYVRLEVEIALRSPDVTVVPVLVGGATMPLPAQLPASLHGLTRHNASELSDTRWSYDVGRLSDTVADIVEALSGTFTTVEADRDVSPRPPRWTIGLALVAVAVAVAALLNALVGDPTGPTERIRERMLELGIAWACIGGALMASVRRDVSHVLGGVGVGAAAGVLTALVFGIPAYRFGADLRDTVGEGWPWVRGLWAALLFAIAGATVVVHAVVVAGGSFRRSCVAGAGTGFVTGLLIARPWDDMSLRSELLKYALLGFGAWLVTWWLTSARLRGAEPRSGLAAR